MPPGLFNFTLHTLCHRSCDIKRLNWIKVISLRAFSNLTIFDKKSVSRIIIVLLIFRFMIMSLKYVNGINVSWQSWKFIASHVSGPYFSFRFVQYKPTSLEKNYKHELLTEVDLGVNIDLIDPDTYAISSDGMICMKKSCNGEVSY